MDENFRDEDLISPVPIIISDDGIIMYDNVMSINSLDTELKKLRSIKANENPEKRYWIFIEQESEANKEDIINILVLLMTNGIYYKIIE